MAFREEAAWMVRLESSLITPRIPLCWRIACFEDSRKEHFEKVRLETNTVESSVLVAAGRWCKISITLSIFFS
jgi:hypothetical protein